LQRRSRWLSSDPSAVRCRSEAAPQLARHPRRCRSSRRLQLAGAPPSPPFSSFFISTNLAIIADLSLLPSCIRRITSRPPSTTPPPPVRSPGGTSSTRPTLRLSSPTTRTETTPTQSGPVRRFPFHSPFIVQPACILLTVALPFASLPSNAVVNEATGYVSMADITTDYQTFASTASSSVETDIERIKTASCVSSCPIRSDSDRSLLTLTSPSSPLPCVNTSSSLPDSVAEGYKAQYAINNEWLLSDVGQLEVGLVPPLLLLLLRVSRAHQTLSSPDHLDDASGDNRRRDPSRPSAPLLRSSIDPFPRPLPLLADRDRRLS
jgi:hypothetical protein